MAELWHDLEGPNLPNSLIFQTCQICHLFDWQNYGMIWKSQICQTALFSKSAKSANYFDWQNFGPIWKNQICQTA
jgi:hypothetical protein